MDEQELTALRQRLTTWDEVADQIPEHHSRAAVALCLAPDAGELSILMMRRVEHPKDPWSGQISLPGGREEPEDASLSVTARRETMEEVDLDLSAEGPGEAEELGLLPPIQARSRGGFMDTTIVPFVHLLSTQPPTSPGPEAAETFWLPLAQIRSGELDGHFSYEKKDGAMVHLPCWNFEERCIWGLTFRIVTELMHPKA
ncbi:MAG: CoA pyrophosphatase [Planctomycetota bacterium]|nr:CoA pyrophosphatase [Planctomycetota bacterium]